MMISIYCESALLSGWDLLPYLSESFVFAVFVWISSVSGSWEYFAIICRTAGLYGYSHMTGGFQGGQAEYVRVPLGKLQ